MAPAALPNRMRGPLLLWWLALACEAASAPLAGRGGRLTRERALHRRLRPGGRSEVRGHRVGNGTHRLGGALRDMVHGVDYPGSASAGTEPGTENSLFCDSALPGSESSDTDTEAEKSLSCISPRPGSECTATKLGCENSFFCDDPRPRLRGGKRGNRRQRDLARSQAAPRPESSERRRRRTQRS